MLFHASILSVAQNFYVFGGVIEIFGNLAEFSFVFCCRRKSSGEDITPFCKVNATLCKDDRFRTNFLSC
jgi:hypothetical protein